MNNFGHFLTDQALYLFAGRAVVFPACQCRQHSSGYSQLQPQIRRLIS
jgi:hypothetical protein